MNKKEFRRIGIDEKYLSEILGTRVGSYELEKIERGPRIRSELYKFHIFPVEGEQFTIFVKDATEGSNNSGDVYRGIDLEKNELRFLVFGKDNQGISTPTYLGHKTHQKEEKEHTIILMEHFDRSLEELLLEDKPEKSVAFNLARRTIDKILVNGYLAKKGGYETENVVGVPTIYEFDETFIVEIINKALHGLVSYKFRIDGNYASEVYDHYKRILSWTGKFGYKSIRDKLMESIVPKLTKKPGELLLPVDLQPANILLNNTLLPDSYDESEDSLVVTDNCRISTAPLGVVSFLVNHIAFDFTPDEMKELAEHTLQHYEKLTGHQTNWTEKEENQSEWAAASRLAWLYRLNFITWLNLNHPEKAAELVKSSYIYEPKHFISTVIDRFKAIDTPNFEDVHTGFDALKPNGNP